MAPLEHVQMIFPVSSRTAATRSGADRGPEISAAEMAGSALIVAVRT
jgi:hypothetical protein